MAWTDLTFSFGAVLTSTQMTQLDDNLDALAAGSSGAPSIQTAALANGSVTYVKCSFSGDIATADIANGAVTYTKCAFSNDIAASDLGADSVDTSEVATGAVHQAELSTAVQSNSASVSQGSYTDITYTGGYYTLMAGISDGFSSSSEFDLKSLYAGSTYNSGICLYKQGVPFGDYYFRAYYLNASPPYKLDEIVETPFIFAIVDNNGDIIGVDISGAPPWVHNGPTNVVGKMTKVPTGKINRKTKLPEFVNKYMGRRKMVPQNILALREQNPVAFAEAMAEFNKSPVYEEFEITPEHKNADMDIVTSPWVGRRPGGTVVMLDANTPVLQAIGALHDTNSSQEEMNEAVNLVKNYTKVGNTPLPRVGPRGVMTVAPSWRNTS